MKIEQKESFQPITFTIETHDEAISFWDIINAYASTKANLVGSDLARTISNWFSNEAHL